MRTYVLYVPYAIDVSYSHLHTVPHPAPYPLVGHEKAMACGHTYSWSSLLVYECVYRFVAWCQPDLCQVGSVACATTEAAAAPAEPGESREASYGVTASRVRWTASCKPRVSDSCDVHRALYAAYRIPGRLTNIMTILNIHIHTSLLHVQHKGGTGLGGGAPSSCCEAPLLGGGAREEMIGRGNELGMHPMNGAGWNR